MMLCQLAYRRLWQSRDSNFAAELAERALAGGLLLAERGAETPDLTGAALPLIFAERLESADSLLDAALAHVRERGSRFGFAHVSFLRAEAAYRRGALQAVEADTRASLDITLLSRVLPGAAAATGLLVAALLERDALDEAAEAFDAIWVAPDDLTPQPPHNLLLSARGQLRIAQGDVSGGLADLYECGRRNEQLGIRHPALVPWRADAVRAHRARDELDAARRLADEELAAARDWGAPGTVGAAQRLVALVTGGEKAIVLLQAATAALADSPARLDYARVLVDLGAALRRANRRVEAREPLRRGLDLADRCGATLLSRRARDELTATGARPRRISLTGVDALTPSERRVAEMAARGLGNIEIAQTLFVTRKTVEKHLSNAYTKLGVASRTELFAHFREPA
jgi:DNA-binding CsgD family transcriptional regulator